MKFSVGGDDGTTLPSSTFLIDDDGDSVAFCPETLNFGNLDNSDLDIVHSQAPMRFQIKTRALEQVSFHFSLYMPSALRLAYSDMVLTASTVRYHPSATCASATYQTPRVSVHRHTSTKHPYRRYDPHHRPPSPISRLGSSAVHPSYDFLPCNPFVIIPSSNRVVPYLCHSSFEGCSYSPVSLTVSLSYYQILTT